MDVEFWVSELKSIRLAANLSRQRVADLAGFNIQALQRYEDHERMPPTDRFIAWAKALGYEIDLFLVIKRKRGS